VVGCVIGLSKGSELGGQEKVLLRLPPAPPARFGRFDGHRPAQCLQVPDFSREVRALSRPSVGRSRQAADDGIGTRPASAAAELRLGDL